MKLYNGDCLVVMKDIPDNSIDLILTDPPYRTISGGVAITKDGKVISDGSRIGNRWLKKDRKSIPVVLKNGTQFKHNNINHEDWMPRAYQILKEGGHFYVMANDRNVQQTLNSATNCNFKLLNILVWKKNNATPNKFYMKNGEFILFFRKGKAKYINNMGTKAIIEVKNIIGNKKHPSEKPVKLMETLINNSSKSNETVLDPFMGSGTTGIACKNLDRNFIGIELDKEYFEIAKNRIENHLGQKEMF